MSELRRLDPMLNHRLLDQHSHAIVNRIRHPAVPFDMSALPIVPAGFSEQECLFPWLVPLGGQAIRGSAKFELLDEIDRRSTQGGEDRAALEAPRVVMLLDCQISDDLLAQQLARRLIVGQPDGSRAMLRWYDPDVLVQLGWMLGDSNWNSLFGPIRQISVWLAGGWYSMEQREGGSSNHLRIDAQEHVRVVRIGVINEVLKAMNRVCVDEILDVSQRIDEAIAKAARVHGFDRDEDLASFARHAMTVHPRFDEHPRIIKVLSEVKAQGREQDPQTYSDATALLTAADWRQVAAELHLAGSSDS